MIRVLELFKGGGSITKYCQKHPDKYEVISLDILSKWNPTIVSDILTWDYKQYPPGYFDIIWASPDCTEYSAMLYCVPSRIRDIDKANGYVIRTLEIIGYFDPKVWFIENPQSGLLKEQPFMEFLPYYDVSYCKYGYEYRKHTRIWTNLEGYDAKFCKQDCGNMENGRHKKNLGNINKQSEVRRPERRYSIPEELMDSLFKCI
jgi:site-specific DNA-cytosine methylase